LASNSPRRRALLAEAGYEFEVIAPGVGEVAAAHLSLRELTIANATRKGLVVSHVHPDRIILAADTLVAIEGEVIGKPRDLNQARVILRRLSARPKCSRNLDCTLLTCLDRNFRRSRRSVGRLAFQDSIQKPNDETVGCENNDRSDAGAIVNMAYFQRNQCSGGEDHEILRPPFL